jgi:Uma2 family endonuclease
MATVLTPPSTQAEHAGRPAVITADHFGEMHRAGVLERLGRCELWDGAIIEMGPQFYRHGLLKRLFADAIRSALAGIQTELVVDQELSVRLHDLYEPVPDIIVCNPSGLDDGPIPVAAVRLIVEVATNSLERDLHQKRPVYARYGVPEYWVVDAAASLVHQFWEPSETDYARSAVIRFGEAIAAQSLSGIAIKTPSQP